MARGTRKIGALVCSLRKRNARDITASSLSISPPSAKHRSALTLTRTRIHIAWLYGSRADLVHTAATSAFWAPNHNSESSQHFKLSFHHLKSMVLLCFAEPEEGAGRMGHPAVGVIWNLHLSPSRPFHASNRRPTIGSCLGRSRELEQGAWSAGDPEDLEPGLRSGQKAEAARSQRALGYLSATASKKTCEQASRAVGTSSIDGTFTFPVRRRKAKSIAAHARKMSGVCQTMNARPPFRIAYRQVYRASPRSIVRGQIHKSTAHPATVSSAVSLTS